MIDKHMINSVKLKLIEAYNPYAINSIHKNSPLANIEAVKLIDLQSLISSERRDPTMILRIIMHVSFYVSFMIAFPALASQYESNSISASSSSDSEDFYDESVTKIVAVPVKKFGDYAAAISEDINSSLDDGVAPDQYFLDPSLYEESEEEIDYEAEEERQRILGEHRDTFIACEKDIYQSTIAFLIDREYFRWSRQYRSLQKEQKVPSHAAIELAKLMIEESEYSYDVSVLLEYIRTKLQSFWNDQYGSEHMFIESRICRALSSYFCDQFNALVERTEPRVPTAPLYTALRKCVVNMMCDPDNSWDDIENTESYIYEFCRRHLKKYALWYLRESEKTAISMSSNFLQVLLRGRVIFKTISYGWMENDFDLLYLLQKWGFKGFRNPQNCNQHIWINFPYQVRVEKIATKKGKLRLKVTAALLKEDPFKHKRQYGNLRINAIIKRDDSDELLKVSKLDSEDDQEVIIVPAFIGKVRKQQFKEMWTKDPDEFVKKDLMDRAHHYIDLNYTNFEYAEKKCQNLNNKRAQQSDNR